MIDKAEFIRESIKYLNQYSQKSLQKELSKYGITVPQMRIINEVMKNHAISVKQISLHLHMSQSTVSEVVERLIKKNILIKTPSLEDKRSVNISLTEHVKEILKTYRSEVISSPFVEALNQLDLNQQEAVVDGITLLMEAVDKITSKKE
ncbi:MarR family winged helix-turn-helix transcriptional regulator [Priestia megaterium]|uniref:MarR family winged helix-turn-helix transcriptional regulator n=1 Tax=Priestia megaterium TaxID=1404 RepID=UPI00336B6B20